MKTVPFLDAFFADALPAHLRRAASMKAVRLVAALREAGLEPEVGHSLSEYSIYAKENSQRMSLSPVFDGAYHPGGSADTMMLYGMRGGQAVASCGARLIWLGTSLADAMESQRFWFGEDSTQRGGEACVVTAPSARVLEHMHIAWVGAGSNFSGEKGAILPMIRLVNLYALANWRWTTCVGIAEPEIAYVENREKPFSRAHDIYGFASAEADIRRGDRRFMLMTSPRRYLETCVMSPSYAEIELAPSAPAVQPETAIKRPA
jgi:hypothetical protein